MRRWLIWILAALVIMIGITVKENAIYKNGKLYGFEIPFCDTAVHKCFITFE